MEHNFWYIGLDVENETMYIVWKHTTLKMDDR